VRHIIKRSQTFLRGHDNDVTVIQVSPSGKYIASGQNTHQGFQVRFL
jgi:WD40 repeat protein